EENTRMDLNAIINLSNQIDKLENNDKSHASLIANKILPSRSVGHPPGPLWQAFDPIKTNYKKPKARCIFCNLNKPISGTAAVMILHIKKCEKIHSEIRAYLMNTYSCQQKLVPNLITECNQQQDNSHSSDGSIASFISVSNYDSISVLSDNNTSENNDFLKTASQIFTQLPIDARKDRKSELVKIRDTLGENQKSAVIFRDLEEVLSTISSAIKIIGFFQKNTLAIQNIHTRFGEKTFRFTLPTFTWWNFFFTSLQQLQNKEQHLKDMAYEMES
ncbi:29145_t:CDS:2, partial [Racocetra persica]